MLDIVDPVSDPTLRAPEFRPVIVLVPLPVLRQQASLPRFDAPCPCGKGNASDCPRDATCNE
jgi:hypothetical protein